MKCLPILIYVALAIMGCTAVQEQPVVEIPHPSDVPSKVPVVETQPQPDMPTEKVPVKAGIFDTKAAQGLVHIIQEANAYKLVVENLQAKLTPDLRLYIITKAGERIEVHKFAEEPIGNFEFNLQIKDTDDIAAVDLYCVYCKASFGVAELK